MTHIPADFGVEGFISGAVFASMAAYWVDSRENRAVDKLNLSEYQLTRTYLYGLKFAAHRTSTRRAYSSLVGTTLTSNGD